MTDTRQSATASGQPREKREAAESRQKHLEKVEDSETPGLYRHRYAEVDMLSMTTAENPQTETARFYVESWETMQAENIGYLFWGGVGTGKSYLAACIANALMEQEVPVCMTNFATILNDLAPASRAGMSIFPAFAAIPC